MHPSFRGRRLLAILAVLFAVGFGVPRFLTHNPYQRLGVNIEWMRGQDFPRIERLIGPPADALLQRGDVIRGIDGQVFSSSSDMNQYLKDNGWPTGPFTLTISRNDHILNIVYPPVRLGAWQRLRLFIFPVSAMIAAPLVAFLLVWRRPDLRAAWVFLAFAVLQAIDVIWGIFKHPVGESGPGMSLYLGSYRALLLWFPVSFLHFMTVFPRPRWESDRRKESPWFWLIVAAYLAPLVLVVTGNADNERAVTTFRYVTLGLGIVSLAARYAMLGRDWRPTAAERIFGILAALAVTLAMFRGPAEDTVAAWFPLPLVSVSVAIVVFAWLVSPLLIAWLLASDPAFDPRRLLARTLPYAILTGVLAALYLGVVLVSQRMFATVTGEQSIIFNVVAALVVAFAFAPLRERMQRWLDRLFGRDPQALRLALDQVGRELLGALSREQVITSVESGLERGLRHRAPAMQMERGMPRIAPSEEVPIDALGGVEHLLVQAKIRLENLALQEERAQHERREVELREAATRAELRALQAQVQPHFLFNALNALAYLIETDSAAAQRFTERLADMLRYAVEAGSRPAALLSDEIEFVEDYLGVARERYENPLTFEYHGARELLSLAVPPLLLQPLVENSLKHGCSPDRRPLRLVLEARRANEWVDLVFTDDGTLNGHGTALGLGVGLENLEQRLRRFGGVDATVKASPRVPGGFEVHMRWRSPEKVAA